MRGGGKKPYKQKGTGNARQGSKSSPLLRGGGVVFGPKVRGRPCREHGLHAHTSFAPPISLLRLLPGCSSEDMQMQAVKH